MITEENFYSRQRKMNTILVNPGYSVRVNIINMTMNMIMIIITTINCNKFPGECASAEVHLSQIFKLPHRGKLHDGPVQASAQLNVW